jgi:hypothetical protein
MISRIELLSLLAIPAFASCLLASCTNTETIKSGGGSDYDGGAAVIGDSGVVQDEPPPGCPTPAASANAAPPSGQMLVAGNSLSTRGVTTDGWEIFSDDYALELYAVPVAGGAAQSIASLGGTFWVTVVGQVVFAWSNVNAGNVGALTVWTSAHGAQAVSSASFGILGSSSQDGSQILYVGNVDPQGQTGDVYMGGSDGSAQTALLKGQQLSGCFPQLGFAGSSVVVSHCDTPAGSGPSATVSSFRAPGWARTDLATGAQNIWSSDTAGTFVLVSTSGGVMVAPIGGGSTTMVDSSGFLGQLIAGGQTAIYGTTSGALRKSSTSSPSPVTLTSPFAGFYGVSPSQNSVLYYQNQASSGATDLFVSSTVTPGAPLTLTSATDGAILGDVFTADSAYALYSTGDNVCTGAATFSAMPVGGGGAIPLGTNVWGDWSTTGAKVIYNDNFVATGGLRYGRADLEAVDLSAGSSPTLLASQADAVIDLTPTRDHVVYSWSVQPGAQAGLYVVAIP